MCLNKLDRYSNWGPLVLRVIAGLIFLLAGWGKVFGGIAGTAGFFGSLGIPAAGILAWVVGLTELIGGLLLILGVLVRWVSIPLGLVMVVALFTAKWGAWTGAGRIDVMLLTSMVALLFLGAGKWALYPECHYGDRKPAKKKR